MRRREHVAIATGGRDAIFVRSVPLKTAWAPWLGPTKQRSVVGEAGVGVVPLQPGWIGMVTEPREFLEIAKDVARAAGDLEPLDIAKAHRARTDRHVGEHADALDTGG